jgi:hypothetical protein
MLTTSTQVLPNLFIVGAAKSGTTSLHNYLDAHPDICMSAPKEPGTFAATVWREKLGEYAGMFSDPEAAIRGDSSTRYSTYPVVQGIPERIASKCPDARLIYVVRDPIDRIVASWVQGFTTLYEHRTLNAVLADLDQPANRFVAASRYATQLERWLEHFDHGQILVIDQTELRDNRHETLLGALEFLGVRPEVPPVTDREFNTTDVKVRMTPTALRLWVTVQPLARRLPGRAMDSVSKSRLFPVEKIGRPALSGELRARLEDELRGEAARFRELTGMSFSSWSI